MATKLELDMINSSVKLIDNFKVGVRLANQYYNNIDIINMAYRCIENQTIFTTEQLNKINDIINKTPII